MTVIEDYVSVVGEEVIQHLRQLASHLRGLRVVHVNSTRVGGGVAEILDRLVPLKQELGIDAQWEIVTGDARFYECTKNFHNSLQGKLAPVSESLLQAFEKTNQRNAEELRPTLEGADLVFIHDPQPLPLLQWCPNRRGKWIWRCHIDLSRPYRPVWKYLRKFVLDYDASIFSLADFSQPLPHQQYLIPPSIDPLAEKNIDLSPSMTKDILDKFGIDSSRPMMLQVSRFDRFKDPLGVIRAYRLAKSFAPGLQLVLAGGGATDDPEGEVVLSEVRAEANGDEDIHVLLLPGDAHVTINALQRSATVILQKSIKEGFGLTVTEGMWKEKPVIGGNTGGIRLQVIDHHTGFRVNTPEGAALRMRYLLSRPEKAHDMGVKAREFVRQNFLITRHLREYLSLMAAILRGDDERVQLEI